MTDYPIRLGNHWLFPDGKTLPVVAGGDGPLPKDVMRGHLEKARALAKTAEDEGREFTDAERAEVEDLLGKATKIGDDMKRAKGDRALVDKIESLSEAGAEALNAKALDGARVGLETPPRAKSIGEQFIESDEFKAFQARYPNGVGEKSAVQMDPVMYAGLKAILGPVELPGLTSPDRQPVVPAIWGRELSLRDLVTVGQTGSDQVEFARQNAMTNAAAPTPTSLTDAADATPTIGEGFKPQSSFTFTKVTTNVKTIAHWLAATKRSLSDAGQLRTLIDSFLRFGLEEELEDQMVSGDGVGENFSGIMTAAGTTAQAYATSPIVTIRKAITKVSTVGRGRATAVALNPLDDEALDLATDTTGRFFGAGPFGTGPSTIWGRPRAVSEAIPVGFAIAADWRFAALWDREQASVSVSDSHLDFFIRNLVAVLGEMRAAWGLIRPAAFVIADLTP